METRRSSVREAYRGCQQRQSRWIEGRRDEGESILRGVISTCVMRYAFSRRVVTRGPQMKERDERG